MRSVIELSPKVFTSNQAKLALTFHNKHNDTELRVLAAFTKFAQIFWLTLGCILHMMTATHCY